jgi:hypothetical protein
MFAGEEMTAQRRSLHPGSDGFSVVTPDAS